MFVSGFTIARNVIKYDYPIREAISSVLPLCDEFVVAVGRSEDDTLDYIRSIGSEKIRIVETVWDDSLRQGGRVLAEETNKALDAVSEKADWAFYIQADECLHEKYLPTVRETMLRYKDDLETDGLLFHYLHFWGSYRYVADSRNWYRKEIRVVRKNPEIRSYRDAQGFRKQDGSKLKVRQVDAYMHHYGWVRDAEKQILKNADFQRLWHEGESLEERVKKVLEFDYSDIDSLKLFDGTHPQVMEARMAEYNFDFHPDLSKKNLSLKDKLLAGIEKYTGYRVGEYKNYKLIR